jgi:hypothetical protein
MSSVTNYDAAIDLQCYESPKRAKTFLHCNNGYEPLNIIDVTWDGTMPFLPSPVIDVRWDGSMPFLPSPVNCGSFDLKCTEYMPTLPSPVMRGSFDLKCTEYMPTLPSPVMRGSSNVTYKEPILNFPPPVLYESIDLTCNELMPILPPVVVRGSSSVTCPGSMPNFSCAVIDGSPDVSCHGTIPRILGASVYLLDRCPKIDSREKGCSKRKADILSEWGFYLFDIERDIVTGDYEVDSFAKYTLQRFEEQYPHLRNNRMVEKACLLIACKVIGDKNLPAMDVGDERSAFERIASIRDGREVMFEVDGSLTQKVKSLLIYTESLVLNTLKFALQVNDFYDSRGIDREFL